MRMPISKRRNKHVQRVLIEAAKLATRECHELAVICDRELERGNPQLDHAGGSQENGPLHARCGVQVSGLRACREVQPKRRQRKAFLKRKGKNIKTHRCADCQVLRLPTGRRIKNSGGSLRIVSGIQRGDFFPEERRQRCLKCCAVGELVL